MITAQKLYPGYEMVLSNLLNPLTGNVVSFYITKLSFIRPDDLKDQQIENIVVVDTRSVNRVKEYFANIGHVEGKIEIFDHHPTDGSDIPGAQLSFVGNGANTSTMVLKLIENGIKLDAVLDVNVAQSVLVRRMVGRRVCKNCGATYHVEFNKPLKDGICDNCGSNLIQRPDDTEATAVNRLAVYDEQTAPLLDYYKKQGILKTVNGDQSFDKVFEDIKAVLK